MHRPANIISALFLCFCAASASAEQTHTHSQKNSALPGVFVFSASKGNVTFDHELHTDKMSSEGCIPCHSTNTPKPGEIKARFDQRVAHYFCRGCHRDKGVGPTECHQCHKKK